VGHHCDGQTNGRTDFAIARYFTYLLLQVLVIFKYYLSAEHSGLTRRLLHVFVLSTISHFLGMDHSFIDNAVDEWRRRLVACSTINVHGVPGKVIPLKIFQ